MTWNVPGPPMEAMDGMNLPDRQASADEVGDERGPQMNRMNTDEHRCKQSLSVFICVHLWLKLYFYWYSGKNPGRLRRGLRAAYF